MLIDTHCHLADRVFVDDLEAVARRAQAVGVAAAMCILSADEVDEVARAPLVTAAWPDVRFAAGVHPHRAGGFAGRVAASRDVVRTALEASAAIAVGEIGLDYHYDHAPRDVQRDVFGAQLDLAVTLARPVVIHTREASDDTFDLLRAAGPSLTGVIHCFTGTIDDARRALDLGFYISLSGIVTFPRSTALREVAAFVPSDRLLAETDAPFLAPVPHRGKRNEPAWVAETCRTVAGVRGMTENDLRACLLDNVATLLPAFRPVAAR